MISGCAGSFSLRVSVNLFVLAALGQPLNNPLTTLNPALNPEL